MCYIVGLGDRHASNILFDQKMCTFVHIDLGMPHCYFHSELSLIAAGMILEYSKRTLPVPEQVPFRISRDLLDPILIEGIENGQLADDCTNTIEKLKQNGKVKNQYKKFFILLFAVLGDFGSSLSSSTRDHDEFPRNGASERTPFLHLRNGNRTTPG